VPVTSEQNVRLAEAIPASWRREQLSSSQWRDVLGDEPRVGVWLTRRQKNEPAVPFIVGTFRKIELAPGSEVIELTDVHGRTHYLDPSYAEQEVRLAPKGETIPSNLKSLAKRTSRPLDRVDAEKLREVFCTYFKKNSSDPRYPAVEKIVKNHVKLLDHRQLFIRYAAACPTLSLAAFIGSGEIWEKLHADRERKIREGEPLGVIDESHSNFLGTFGFLTALDRCAKMIEPRARMKVLATLVGVGVLGNIQSEVKGWEGRPDFVFTHIKNVKDDPQDLEAGLAGVALYAVSALAVEQILGFGLGKICK
jgi:hypothetical protein